MAFRMTALQRTIEQQADAIAEVSRLDISRAARSLRAARRLRLVGTGTSQHAAELGAFLLRTCGVPAQATGAAETARWDSFAADDGVIVLSHTGETAFALRCRAQASAAGCPLVSITGPGAGWPEAIVTPIKEESETYTASYLTALAVLGLLAHELASADPSPSALREVAEQVRAAAAKPELEQVAVPARALAIVGVGPWAITAREGALKIREAARMICEGFDGERLLHGAAVPYGPADGLVILQPDADPDGLLDAIARAAAEEGIPVSVLASHQRSASPYLDQFAMTVRLQSLASRLATQRRTDPDVAIVGAWGHQQLWTLGAP
jgi:glucosamine--fructose-6-phosphate aminotransferase (isomerizing)